MIFNVLVPMVLWIWALRAQTGADDAIKRIMFRQVDSHHSFDQRYNQYLLLAVTGRLQAS